MRLDPAKVIYYVLFAFAGLLPATVLAVTAAALVLHADGWLRAWGVFGILGTIGLWAALLQPPWNPRFRVALALTSLMLLMGIGAMSVLMALASEGRPFWSWCATLGPVVVALTYVGLTLSRWGREN